MEKNLKTTISGKYYFLALGIFILFSFIFFYFSDFSPFKSFKISDSAFKVDFSSQALKNFHFPRDKLQKPILLLTFQIFLMIFLSRGLVTILKKNGQPAILGEIGAGIVLGPTVLGLIFPNFYRIFFPESSISILSTLSQFGMLIFMFVVGMNLDAVGSWDTPPVKEPLSEY
ncbi:MAG: cation:proton antiporter [Leptospiraceae bacterium]|nr:cation:proton antiporter [Leptospiraceae bacterium]